MYVITDLPQIVLYVEIFAFRKFHVFSLSVQFKNTRACIQRCVVAQFRYYVLNFAFKNTRVWFLGRSLAAMKSSDIL